MVADRLSPEELNHPNAGSGRRPTDTTEQIQGHWMIAEATRQILTWLWRDSLQFSGLQDGRVRFLEASYWSPLRYDAASCTPFSRRPRPAPWLTSFAVPLRGLVSLGFAFLRRSLALPVPIRSFRFRYAQLSASPCTTGRLRLPAPLRSRLNHSVQSSASPFSIGALTKLPHSVQEPS